MIGTILDLALAAGLVTGTAVVVAILMSGVTIGRGSAMIARDYHRVGLVDETPPWEDETEATA